NVLFPQLFVMLKKLSSEYQPYTCGNFFRIPRFEKKLLFSDSLLRLFSVIPAKAGIQYFQAVADHIDSGFHRSDDFLRVHQYLTNNT
ncbi:MAG: hypothetical protein U9R17_08245, partial [Thermodesulfobacteriota bacterium]|nr:hypothetical protein [Thermodesulfobacteriota bacterium]